MFMFRLESLSQGQGSTYSRYAFEIEGNSLWCNEKKFPGFIINRDMTFNKSASLTRQREDTIARTDGDTDKHVEIEVDAIIQFSSEDELQIDWHSALQRCWL